MNDTKTNERAAWLAERKQGIGGSDAAAVLGVSPWATPVNVWLDKTGRAEPKEETEAMMLGTELEDYVARRYAEQTGRTVRRFNKMIHQGCLLGNFDRLVVPEGEKVASHMGEVRTDLLLECKTSGLGDWPDGVPIYYQTQVLHYMGLAPELQHADVAVLFRARLHFEIFRVERDDELIKAMQERLTAWWHEYVLGDKMPPPTNEADCKMLWARSNPGKTVTADANIVEDLQQLAELRRQIAVAENAKAGFEDRIKAAMGDAETLVGVDGAPLATWKSGKDRSTTDWKGLAAELQATDAQIAAHTTTKPGNRTFLLKIK